MTKAKSFSLHWGSRVVQEEVQSAGPYHRPTIQLLKFLDGEAAGTWQIRFCYYDHAGRFQRSPLIIGNDDLPKLRAALMKAPRLRALLKRLVA
jgi:hypothetical protein